MDESDVKRLIVAELKDMRRGHGFSDYMASQQGKRCLLITVVGGDRMKLRDMLLKRLECDKRNKALGNALLLTPDKADEDSDLTSRRDRFAEENGISDRTIIRHEDEAINRLADELASEFTSNEVYWKAIERDYPNQPPIELRTTASDLPGLVRAQARFIANVEIELEALGEQVDALRRVNRMLAKMAGVEG